MLVKHDRSCEIEGVTELRGCYHCGASCHVIYYTSSKRRAFASIFCLYLLPLSFALAFNCAASASQKTMQILRSGGPRKASLYTTRNKAFAAWNLLGLLIQNLSVLYRSRGYTSATVFWQCSNACERALLFSWALLVDLRIDSLSQDWHLLPCGKRLVNGLLEG